MPEKHLGHRTTAARTMTVRQIRFRFSSHVNQIARVCDLSYEEVARMMDSV